METIMLFISNIYCKIFKINKLKNFETDRIFSVSYNGLDHFVNLFGITYFNSI